MFYKIDNWVAALRMFMTSALAWMIFKRIQNNLYASGSKTKRSPSVIVKVSRSKTAQLKVD